MTTEEQALLAAVLARPDDDLPRLVYADYLEELGTDHQVARAEFIRLQCALADTNEYSHPHRATWQIRERVLLNRFGPAWLAPLRERGQPLFTPRSHGQFRRGFVEIVWMPAGWFVDKATKLFRQCPVTELRITHTTASAFETLCRSPELNRLTRLDVTDRKLGDIAVIDLVDAGCMKSLRELILRACNVTELSLPLLHVLCWRLRVLDLSMNELSAEDFQELRLAHPEVSILGP